MTREAAKGAAREAPKTAPNPNELAAKAPPSSLRVFRSPPWQTRLTVQGMVSFPVVRTVRAAPLTEPNRYIAFLDPQGEEICMVNDPAELDDSSRRVVEQELAAHYVTATIERIDSLRNEFGTSYWDVQTNRGARDFVVQNAAENARWLAPNRLLLVDVDGNRFEIPDLRRLDKRSVGLVRRVL